MNTVFNPGESTSIIEAILPLGVTPPKPGAKRVFWLMRGPGLRLQWEHKGWLMPPVNEDES